MRKILAISILIIGITPAVHSQTDVPPPPPPPVDTAVKLINVNSASNLSQIKPGDYLKDLEQLKDKDGGFGLVFWIPWQYWESALLQAKNSTSLNYSDQSVINSMKDFTVMCVVDGSPGIGGINYTDSRIVEDSIRLVIGDTLELRPLEEKTLNSTMSNLMAIMKPLMKSMLGQMGDNMMFFVFKNSDRPNHYYIDASQTGNFYVTWRSSSVFKWNLPVNVLTPPKYCPVDNEMLSGKYTFCPYHGVKLTDSKK